MINVTELIAHAKELGANLNISNKDLIDETHLNCIWYGGPIAALEYKGYTVNFDVHGDVRLSILSDDYSDTVFDYCNKNNSGAYTDAEFKHYIPDDETLYRLDKEEKLVWNNNNWLEMFVYDSDDNEITHLNTVLDDNLWEELLNIDWLIEALDQLPFTTVLFEHGGHETRTEYNETQVWIHFKNKRSLEITFEKNGLKREEWFISIRLYCTDIEFTNGNYNKSLGIMDTYCVDYNDIDIFTELIEQFLEKNGGLDVA